MSLKQIAVFVENHKGTLSEITDLLAAAKIDIRALSISETQDFGILRMIVNDNEKAKSALAANNSVYTVTDVIGVQIPDSPGGISGVISLLSDNDVNIEYVYAFVGVSGKFACVVLRVADNEKAEKLLTEKGYKTLTDKDIEQL